MTARLAASLSALLLLGVASTPAVAELVPVEPNMPPAAYYGLPEPEEEVLVPAAPQQGAKPANPPAAGTPGGDKAAAPKPEGPGELIESWDGGAAKKNWQYWVNGTYGDRSFAVFELQAQDTIVWRFTTEQGK